MLFRGTIGIHGSSRANREVGVVVDRKRALGLLREREEEGKVLAGSVNHDALSEWVSRTSATFRAVLPVGNPLIDEFSAVRYRPSVYVAGTDFTPYRTRGVNNALGIIRTALYEIEELNGGPLDSGTGYDDELWQHVAEVVIGERWETVASQSVIFLEDRLREWSGRPPVEYGKQLVANVLRPGGGNFPLGRTDGEKQGWMNFGIGIVGAVGNAARHRIDERTDSKRYALGVLGAVSLLLTELRNSYSLGNADLDRS